MYFKYNVGNEVKDFFYHKLGTTMSYYRGEGFDEPWLEIPMQTDENGNQIFIYGDTIIMFDDYLCYTPQELVEKIQNGESVRSEEFCQVLMRYGLDSISILEKVKKMDVFNFGGFCVGFESHSSADKDEDFDWVEYEFVSEYLCEPKDNYKFYLLPKDDTMKSIYPSRRYYTCDFVSLIAARPDMFQVRANVSEIAEGVRYQIP